MSDSDKEPVGEVETAMLDADLFLKYGSPDRALKRLKTALERSPRSINLRERMREIAASHKHPEEAARHCLALASLYIERDNFDAAHDRLLEAKQLDNRISISSGLEAIRRARHPELKPQPAPAKTRSPKKQPAVTFAGELPISNDDNNGMRAWSLPRSTRPSHVRPPVGPASTLSSPSSSDS